MFIPFDSAVLPYGCLFYRTNSKYRRDYLHIEVHYRVIYNSENWEQETIVSGMVD